MRSKKQEQRNMHQLILTVTSPTRELNSRDYIDELIQPFTNYQVIPSPLITNYQVDHIILAALPASRGKLLDISLPLNLTDISGNQINYFGRYLLYNCRLIGIKLSSSTKEEMYSNGEFKKWKSGTYINFKIPNIIMNYYRYSKFPEGTYRGQIPAGDFVLVIGQTKICLLFQTQIEQKQTALYEYKKHGCEIFSIVCDVPKENEQGLNLTNSKQNTKNQNMLKRFGKQNQRIIIYAGVRMATTRALFLSNSFIFHPFLQEKSQNNIESFFFNDAVSLSLICNFFLEKKINLEEMRMENRTKPKQELIEDVPFFCYTTNLKLGDVKKAYTNGRKQINTFTKDHGDLLKKMKLWYMYNSDNRQRPFIFALPLSPKLVQAVRQLQKLSSFLEVPVEDFIIFYNKDKFISQPQQFLGIHTYRDLEQLCEKSKDQILNIYTDDQNNYQQLLARGSYNNRLRVYYNYIDFKESKEVRVIKEKNNKLNQFADYIIRNRFVGYHKLLTEARSDMWKLNKNEQIEAITVNLANKLRTNVQHHPFYKGILLKSKNQIEQALAQAEIKLINTSGLSLTIQNRIQSSSKIDEEVSIQSNQKQKQKDFLAKMKELKRTQQKQMKIIQLTCHSCKVIYDKQYFYRCDICRTKTCFLCSSAQINEKKDIKSKKELLDSLRCIVCKKLCNCIECQNRIMKPEQSFDLSTTLKLIEISSPSLVIYEDQKKKVNEQTFQSCTVCLINDRKGGRIRVACSTCDYQECLLCIRNSGGANTLFTREWICSKCQPDKFPAPQLMPDINQDSKSNKEIQVEAREPSISKSRSNSPSKNVSSFKNNQYNRPYNNNNNNNTRPYQNNNNNNRSNNFSRNNNNNNERGRSKMIDQQEENKSNRSLSRSQSIPRNRNKAPQRKNSGSGTSSPKKQINVKENPIKKSSPQSNKGPKVSNWNNNNNKKSRSVSVSPSPKRDANKLNKNERDPSNSATPPRKQNQRKRSNSGSGSRTPPKNKKKRSSSHSKKSNSRSYSRSRSKQRNRDNSSNDYKGNQSKPEKLWNNQKKWGNNNNNNNYNNNNNNNNYNNNNQRFQNNRGGRGGQGGFRGRGGFDRNYNDRGNQGNSDRYQRDGNNNNRRGGYNNNYNNNNNNNNRERDNSRNGQQSNQNNQIVSVNNYQSNNDMDY